MTSGRMVKVESKGTIIEEAVCTVKEQTTKFFMHVFIKGNEIKAFEDSKIVADT